MIPSLKWAKANQVKIARFKHMYKHFIKIKTAELANKLIVDPIVEEMRQNNVSRKIYENVVVKDVIIDDLTGTVMVKIHCEYFSEDGFDVAVAREYGTEDHMIRPKGKENGGADVLSWIQNGRRRFSGGHNVSGLPKLNIIERRVEWGEYELQQALNLAYREWKSLFGFSHTNPSDYALGTIYS